MMAERQINEQAENTSSIEDPSIESGVKCATEADFEGILKWTPPEAFSKDYFYEICGRTECGCPILTIQAGNWDFRKISSKEEKEMLMKYVDLMYARLDQQMKKNSKIVGKQVNQYMGVFDFDNFSMKQILSFNAISNWRQWARRYELKYTGSVKNLIVVNASSVFRSLTTIMKPLFASNTLGVFEIYGSNQNEWKDVLLSKIPEDQLPFRLGGTLVPPGTQVVDYKKLIYGRRYSIFAEASMDVDVDVDVEADEEKDDV